MFFAFVKRFTDYIRKNIWPYAALATFPLFLIALWVLFWSPFYILDHFSAKESYGKEVFFHMVGWPLIGLFFIKAHICILWWWGLLAIHFVGKFIYNMPFFQDQEVERVNSKEKEELLEELKRDDF